MADYDLLLSEAYTLEHGEPVDIGIKDGLIVEVGALGGDADRVIELDGDFVSPGLVDAHKHVDRALVSEGDRVPRGNETAFDMERSLEHERAYYANATVDDIAENVVRNLKMAVSHGSTYVRSHLTVDTDTRGTDTVAAAVRAREETSDLVDVQFVPSSYEDTTPEGRAVLEEAIEMADDGSVRNAALLGGSDPAARTGDLAGTLDLWFELAEKHDVDVDFHIDEPHTLGGYVLERLADYVEEYGFEGRATATHGYGLAQMPAWRASEVIERLVETEIGLITCYNSVRHGMPMKELLTTDGLAFAHGTDNDRDFVLPHGNANQIEAMIVLVNKLHAARELAGPDAEYRWLESNPGLAALWELLTYGGARILGIEDEYGIEEGNPANLAVFGSPSPQWAIFDQEDPTHVVKDGRVVAENGALV